MKRNIVNKHAAVIHCSNNLSLLQRKISNALLFNAYPELENCEEHEISMTQLSNILGITSNNSQALKDALRALVQTVLEWNIVNDQTGDEDWTATTVLASVNLSAGICSYSYSPRMRRLLHSPSIYGKINLIIQSRFRSSYGLALYENCARYRKLAGTRVFSLDEFRRLMGVKESQYTVFRDFKRRVLDKAVDEVNTYSDISVKPEVLRAGRKVKSIKFYIKDKPPQPRFSKQEQQGGADKDVDIGNNTVTHRLTKDFGISKDIVDNLIKNYGSGYLTEKIDFLLSSPAFVSGNIRDVASYYIAAVKGDYKDSKPVGKVISEQKKLVEQKAEQEKEVLQSANEKKKAYSGYVREKFFEHFLTLESSIQDELIGGWLNTLSSNRGFMSSRLKRLYKNSGFEHQQVFSDFRKFVFGSVGSWPQVKCFEEFCVDELTPETA